MTESTPPAGAGPDEPTSPAAAAGESAVEPGPPSSPAAAPFPQVLRTPWINPARRRHVVLVSILALLLVGGAAFVGGVAVGHHRDHDRCGEAAYHGRYVPLQGIEMSRAYESTLTIDCAPVGRPGRPGLQICGPRGKCRQVHPGKLRPKDVRSSVPAPSPSPTR
jgi:hypothetical protein